LLADAPARARLRARLAGDLPSLRRLRLPLLGDEGELETLSREPVAGPEAAGGGFARRNGPAVAAARVPLRHGAEVVRAAAPGGTAGAGHGQLAALADLPPRPARDPGGDSTVRHARTGLPGQPEHELAGTGVGSGA